MKDVFGKKIYVVIERERDGGLYYLASNKISEMSIADGQKVAIYELKEVKTYNVNPTLK